MNFAINTISYVLYTFGASYLILTASLVESGQTNEEDWLYFVDENGTKHIMNYSTVPHDTEDMVLGDAYFYLYTRNNQMNQELLKIPGGDSLLESNYFNKSNDIRVITHGWITSENATWLQNIKNTFLHEYELNVITVDWSELSKNIIYPFAACSTRYVGKRVAKLLDALIRTYNVKGDSIHLIGHSLGAQVMGYAGMFCSEKVLRVTGLDPARPLFEFPEMENDFRLDKSDAKFVDVIHTCGGIYGYKESHGHADFYPNNGKSIQPGCSGLHQYAVQFINQTGAVVQVISIDTPVYTWQPKSCDRKEVDNLTYAYSRGVILSIEGCSHGRAYEYFDESIEYKPGFGFTAYSCESWEKYETGKCNENPSEMGYMAKFDSRGNYYLRTRNESKYVTNSA